MALCRLVPILALGLLLATASSAFGQPKTFLFSYDSKDKFPIADLDKPAESDRFTDSPKLRPNVGQNLFLYVKNDTGDFQKKKVELLDLAGKTLAAADVEIGAREYARVKLVKPPPPMPPPGTPPAPMPTPTPMPMAVPPPPPGAEVTMNDAGQFEMVLRATDSGGKVENQRVQVTILAPANYVAVADPQLAQSAGASSLTIEVEANSKAGVPFEQPCIVELRFPPQDNLNVDGLREGVYRRTLTAKDQKEKLVAKNLPIQKGADASWMFYLTVDGVPRGYIYNWKGTADQAGVRRQTKTDGRVIEVGKKKPEEIISLPKEKLPVRIEIDNPGTATGIELQLKPADKDEVLARILLKGTQHEQVWLDPAVAEGALLFSTRVADWVTDVDTRDLRGRFKLFAVLTKDRAPVKDSPSPSIDLALDDTPPELVKIDTLPEKHFRGRPLPVSVLARDLESRIAKVAIFVGKPGPDGKLPEGAVLIDAAETLKDSGVWVAKMPVPADMKGGTIILTAVATNGVGLPATNTQSVQLLDPPTGGTIKGEVKLGQFGKAQEGITVTLKDADGKDKGTTKTAKKGEFIFEDVPPGSYKVSAARADAATGTKGEEGVRVLAGKESKVTITLTRKP